MATKQVKIEDTLKERCEDAINEVEEYLINWLEENPDVDEVPDINDLDYDGRIHEIIDGSVPIYTSEIEDTWYLYGSKLEESYDYHGFGHNPRENNGMTAIYCYIMDAVYDWYNENAGDVFENWKSMQTFICDNCGKEFNSEEDAEECCEDY